MTIKSLAALSILLASGVAFAQCKICATDGRVCKGFVGSYPFCDKFVICDLCGSPQSKPYVSQLQPGLLLRQQKGQLTVVAVFPGSPANQANIREGDEILSVNGKEIGSGVSCDDSWDFRNSGRSHVTVRRGNTVSELTVHLRPLRDFVVRRWQGSTIGEPVAASYSTGTNEALTMKPFTFGIHVREHDSHLFVADILVGSPANRIGIRIGDEITSIDGIPFGESKDQAGLHLLGDGDYSRVVEVGVLRDGAYAHVRLQAAGISQVLSNDVPASAVPSWAPASVAEAAETHR